MKSPIALELAALLCFLCYLMGCLYPLIGG